MLSPSSWSLFSFSELSIDPLDDDEDWLVMGDEFADCKLENDTFFVFDLCWDKSALLIECDFLRLGIDGEYGPVGRVVDPSWLVSPSERASDFGDWLDCLKLDAINLRIDSWCWLFGLFILFLTWRLICLSQIVRIRFLCGRLVSDV